jgi:hypothetical protein
MSTISGVRSRRRTRKIVLVGVPFTASAPLHDGLGDQDHH